MCFSYFLIEVIFLKIFLLTKRTLIISCIITLITALILILLFTFNSPVQLAVEITHNSVFNEEFISKITNLTKGEEKIAYLTFDDGPTTSVTPKVLDILKEQNVKATFFVIGKSVEAHPEIVKRAYEEGHYIANHGYSHNNSKLYKSLDSFKNEIEKTDSAIGKALGKDDYCSHIFRFPNGFMSSNYKSKKKEAAKLLSQMNYAYIDWNCLNNDSIKKYSSSQLLSNLKKSCKNKNTLVVLMHDTKDVSNSSLALEDSISYLKSQGYTFRNFYSFLPEK